jgi:hypothetical protein
MQLTLDSSILEHLLERAAAASRLVGHFDERAGVTLVEPLADSIDEIVHVLSELLGSPQVIIAPVPSTCSSCAVDLAAHRDVGRQLVRSEVVAPDRPVCGAPGAVRAALAAEATPVSASDAGGAR